MVKRITYILLMFPKLTTTFIDREIFALQEMGVEVRVYSLRRPKGPLSGYQGGLQQEATYVYPAAVGSQLKAHLHFIFARPRQYFSTLFHLLSRPHPTFLSHRRTLLHFIQGIYVAYLLRDNPGDHIHAHFLNQAATVALIVSRMLGIPYSVTVHSSGEFYANPMMICEKLEGAKFIATCTQYNRDYLADLGKNLFEEKLMVNYHGVDVGQYSRQEAKPSEKPVILSVGQLRERKGMIYLVEACAILKQRGLDFVCRLIGEGPEREPLEAEIEQLGLTNQIELIGALPQEELIHQYEQADIFALPVVMAESGDRDGIPNVILEAMAMELPVVSTRNMAIPEVIRDGENGLLVPPKDPHSLADALHRLLTNKSYADRLGCEGRKTILKSFDPHRNVQDLFNAFMA